MNDKYDLILEKIEKEIDNVFPNNVTNKWIFNAVGKIETDISCQAADNINIPGLDLIKRGGKRWSVITSYSIHYTKLYDLSSISSINKVPL